MATQLPAGSIVQATIVQDIQSNTILNVLHYQYNAAQSAADYVVEMQELILGITKVGGIVQKMQIMSGGHWIAKTVRVQPVYPGRLAPIDSPDLNMVGNLLGAPVPMNTALTIVKKTVNATRWGRGSFHLGGQTTDQMENSGSWNVGTVNEATALGLKIIENLPGKASSSFFTPVLWNVKQPDRITQLFDAKAQSSIRTMRRRTLGQGI